MINSEDKEDR